VRKGVILDSLLARERLGSTGLGHGIAIPHGRVRGLREAVGALIRTRNGVAYDAPDDQPVHLIFVLLVPEKSTDVHLEILGGLAQMFSDRQLRGSLAAAADPVSAQQLIAGWEARGPR
jgi:PTS system nitrogen regulatory IIA component